MADAAEIAGRDQVGLHVGDVGDLAIAQPARQVGLEDLVGTGPAAAQVPLRHVLHDEACRAQQRLGRLGELLAVLHRAGRVVGHDQRRAVAAHRSSGGSQLRRRQHLADVAGQFRHARRGCVPIRVFGQQVAVVLQRRAAAGGIGDDGVERPPGVAGPAGDVPAGQLAGLLALADMQHRRAAAA
jgi:hypothetical protein